MKIYSYLLIIFMSMQFFSLSAQNVLATLPQNDTYTIELFSKNKVKQKRTYYQPTSTEPKILSQTEFFDKFGRIICSHIYNPKGDTVIVDSFFYNKNKVLCTSKSFRLNGANEFRDYEYLTGTQYLTLVNGIAIQGTKKTPIKETYQYSESAKLLSAVIKDVRYEEKWEVEILSDSSFVKRIEKTRNLPNQLSPLAEQLSETYLINAKNGRVLDVTQYSASKKLSQESTTYNSLFQVTQKFSQMSRMKGLLTMTTYDVKGLPEAETHSSGAYISYTYSFY
jgi:hypothetical protein